MTIKTRNIGDSAVTAGKLKAASITGASIAADAIDTSEILNGAVDGEHLATTLKTGYIPLNINLVSITGSDVYGNTIEARNPDGNTDPSYQRVNGATDKAARLIWATSSVIEVDFPPFVLPPDIDSTAVLTVKVAGTCIDANTLAISYFEGVGDTNAGGATGALTSGVTVVSREIAAADVGAAGAAVTIGLTPGAHGSNALHVYAAWVEYTRA